MFGTATAEATISELRAGLGCYLRRFDASVLSTADAVIVVDEAARMEKMAATLKSLAAARAAEADLLGNEGDLSPAHALARRSGTSVSKAAEALRTSRRLACQPGLDAAARRGDVSPDQAAAISDAVAADPASESRLVAKAASSSLAQLRDECERTKVAADGDAEERHRRIHAARYARRRSCPDGSAEIVYRSTRDEIAEAWAIVGGFINQVFDQARLAGVRESAEAYAADGVLAMARAAAHAAGGTTAGGGPAAGGAAAGGAGAGGAGAGGAGAGGAGAPHATNGAGTPGAGGDRPDRTGPEEESAASADASDLPSPADTSGGEHDGAARLAI